MGFSAGASAGVLARDEAREEAIDAVRMVAEECDRLQVGACAGARHAPDQAPLGAVGAVPCGRCGGCAGTVRSSALRVAIGTLLRKVFPNSLETMNFQSLPRP